MKQTLPAKQLAAQGRNGDSLLAHMTPGEVTVPASVLPAVHGLLSDAFTQQGMDINRYTAGHQQASRNPKTGLLEFADDNGNNGNDNGNNGNTGNDNGNTSSSTSVGFGAANAGSFGSLGGVAGPGSFGGIGLGNDAGRASTDSGWGGGGSSIGGLGIGGYGMTGNLDSGWGYSGVDQAPSGINWGRVLRSGLFGLATGGIPGGLLGVGTSIANDLGAQEGVPGIGSFARGMYGLTQGDVIGGAISLGQAARAGFFGATSPQGANPSSGTPSGSGSGTQLASNTPQGTWRDSIPKIPGMLNTQTPPRVYWNGSFFTTG